MMHKRRGISLSACAIPKYEIMFRSQLKVLALSVFDPEAENEKVPGPKPRVGLDRAHLSGTAFKGGLDCLGIVMGPGYAEVARNRLGATANG